MKLRLNETLEERMKRAEKSKSDNIFQDNKQRLTESTDGIVYWEDIKDQYSEEDNYWDSKYTEKQIQAWRDQWKK